MDDVYWGSIEPLGISASAESSDALWAKLEDARAEALSKIERQGGRKPSGSVLPRRATRLLLVTILAASLGLNFVLLWRAVDPLASTTDGLTRGETSRLLGLAGVVVDTADGSMTAAGTLSKVEFKPTECTDGRCRRLVVSMTLPLRSSAVVDFAEAERAALRANRELSDVRCWADAPLRLVCATDIALVSVDPVEFAGKVVRFISLRDRLLEMWLPK